MYYQGCTFTREGRGVIRWGVARSGPSPVMPGPVPGIHDLTTAVRREVVDARHKGEHDGRWFGRLDQNAKPAPATCVLRGSPLGDAGASPGGSHLRMRAGGSRTAVSGWARVMPDTQPPHPEVRGHSERRTHLAFARCYGQLRRTHEGDATRQIPHGTSHPLNLFP